MDDVYTYQCKGCGREIRVVHFHRKRRERAACPSCGRAVTITTRVNHGDTDGGLPATWESFKVHQHGLE